MKYKSSLLLVLSLFIFAGCFSAVSEDKTENIKNDNFTGNLSVAYFSGGCFWCSESDFEKKLGVSEVISGYLGGEVENPTYKQVSSGVTGHREGVKVFYDENVVSFDELLDVYFKHIDPTDGDGSFVDRGYVYSSAIYYLNDNEKVLSDNYILSLENSNKFEKDIKVVVEEFVNFYPAETYHQDYYKKNPVRYNYYRSRSGRDDFINKYWTEKVVDLKERLTPLQYEVTQNGGTEKPFSNLYWNNTQKGIYVDIISGEALFSSTDKYKSGTGWPSFSKPIDKSNIVLKNDYKLIIPRVEVKTNKSDSHLGHVFDDGPKELGGLRYCLNSASLNFVKFEDMERLGYGDYLYLFE